jgi:hypothetical protein
MQIPTTAPAGNFLDVDDWTAHKKDAEQFYSQFKSSSLKIVGPPLQMSSTIITLDRELWESAHFVLL